MENNLYTQIRETFASCKTIEDWKDAYRWLAGELVNINESAKAFEDRAKEMLPEKQFGAILYGNERAYEKTLEYDERMSKAPTPYHRQMIMFETLMDEELENIKEIETLDILADLDKEPKDRQTEEYDEER
jgi:hypothetical protein